MKALFERVELGEQRSLLVKHVRLPYFDAPWHFHPEYELTYILRSRGKRFVGDHIEDFDAGDLVLLGPDLPHFWRNDEVYYQAEDAGDTLAAEAIVIQFAQHVGATWLSVIPEADRLTALLTRARYGLRFDVHRHPSVRELLLRMPEQGGMEAVLSLLRILTHLSADTSADLLASGNYELRVSEADTERMKRVLDYTLTHFRREIRIDDIASVAGMAPAAFCRYFKKRTRKSFIEYLNELRVSHARKLLIESDVNVGEAALECGFNNISHFHRQFKEQTGTTPLQYQALHRGL